MKKYLFSILIFALLGIASTVTVVRAETDWVGLYEGVKAALIDLQDRVDFLEVNQKKELHLYDHNGQDLGIMLKGSTLEPYVESLNAFVTIGTSTDPTTLKAKHFVSDDQVYYVGPGCTGDPYLQYRLSHMKIIGTGDDRYYKGTTNVAESVTVNSVIYANGVCHDGAPLTITGVILEEVTLPFTEPIKWPLHIVEV